MATKLETLLAQQAEIAKQINQAKKEQRQPVIDEIKKQIKEYKLTASQLGFKTKKTETSQEDGTKAEKKPAVAKYRNEKNEEWAGRGKPPKWMAGADGKISPALKTKYAIKK